MFLLLHPKTLAVVLLVSFIRPGCSYPFDLCHPLKSNGKANLQPFRVEEKLSYLRLAEATSTPLDMFETINPKGTCVRVYIAYTLSRLIIILHCNNNLTEYIELPATTIEGADVVHRWTLPRATRYTVDFNKQTSSLLLKATRLDVGNKTVSFALVVGYASDIEIRHFDGYRGDNHYWRFHDKCECRYRLRLDISYEKCTGSTKTTDGSMLLILLFVQLVYTAFLCIYN